MRGVLWNGKRIGCDLERLKMLWLMEGVIKISTYNSTYSMKNMQEEGRLIIRVGKL